MQKIIIKAQCSGSVKSCNIYAFKLIDIINEENLGEALLLCNSVR